MKVGALKMFLGFGILILQFGVIVLIAVFALDKFQLFMWDEWFSSVAIISPMFAAWCTVIVRDFLKDHADAKDDARAPVQKTVVTFLIFGFFAFSLVSAVLLKAYGPLRIEGFLKMLAVIETVIGVHMVIVIESYFGKPSDQHAEAEAPSPVVALEKHDALPDGEA